MTLRTSRLRLEDCILVFSEGGGNLEKNASPNLVPVVQSTRSIGAKIAGIEGRDDGYATQAGPTLGRRQNGTRCGDRRSLESGFPFRSTLTRGPLGSYLEKGNDKRRVRLCLIS
jgi:hypothetical protein